MPTYEYACEKCGAHFDVVHGFNERGPRKCRECGGGPLRKVFHPAGIVLKGSGFYKTDTRSSSGNGSSTPKKSASSESKSDSGSGSGGGEAGGSSSKSSSSSDD